MMRRQQKSDSEPGSRRIMTRNQTKKIKEEEEMSNLIHDDELVDPNDQVRLIQPDRTSECEDSDDDKKPLKQNVRKDLHNIALLMFLYLLQGIPLGLSGSIPFILSSRQVSYADQGTFSFALWPFSLKLLWAPVVDSVFIKRMGRRKSWLVPIQYMLGTFMILFANYTQKLLEGDSAASDGSHSSIFILTCIFFMFTFLAATQDIAVDGWALTMLSKENVSWGSTCNSVGQTAGWFIGNVIFLTLESADFCNKNVRPLFGLDEQNYGMVTIDKFMFFFGCTFVISTTLVLLFKAEKNNSSNSDDDEEFTVKETYQQMWKVIWLIPIKKLILILMTVKLCFAADALSYLKLIEAGVPKEKLGLLAVPLAPLQIILPLVISKYTNGPKPFDFFIRAIPFRLFMGLVVAGWVYATPYFKDENNEYPFYYYVICVVVNMAHTVFAYTMFVSQMSFYAQISDKSIGGTYMTLLNTLSNLGGVWPQTLALYLANVLTFKYCSADSLPVDSINYSKNLSLINDNACSSEIERNGCVSLGGVCITRIDAFYIETIACTLFGIFWLIKFKSIMKNLQDLPKAAWKLK